MSGRAPRRRFLALLGTSIAGIAGCAGDDGGGGSPTDAGGTAKPTGTPTAAQTEPVDAEVDGTSTGTGSATPTKTTDELDLREANVVDVAVTDEGEGRYEFDVSLHHDDEGEDGYANWWQVETLDGQRLGRRELLHAHSQQPFTRSETIEVPEGVECVVVRGHDRTHAYGGQAMVVTIPSGDTAAVQQGADPDDLADRECPGQ